MPRKKKQHQTRLTFEPIGSSESPSLASPANVRFTKDVATSSSSSHTSSQREISTSDRSYGLPQRAASLAELPKANFMLKPRVPVPGYDPTEHLAEEVEKDEVAFPESSQSISAMLRKTGFEAKGVIITDEGGGDGDDDDDEPVIPPSSRKRLRTNFTELEDSSDGVASPAKKSKTSKTIPSRLKKAVPSDSSLTKHRLRKSHRTEKQKKIELLRRRRAGEKIDRVTSSEDSEEEKRGIYDSDSEDEFGALKEFDDEEESDKEKLKAPTYRAPQNPDKPAKSSQKGSEDEEDLDNFVVDDDDAPLGAPANLDIPLEFTAQAHRPLKEQFTYVIEWLVHNRINPAFNRNDPVYTNAWRKLNDEVQGLASSKFSSSAWKPEFHKALKGRPSMLVYEMAHPGREPYSVCEACGRSKHRPSQVIIFSGHPYYKDTLGEVESESTSDSDSEGSKDEAGDNESIDSQGMALPPATKRWHVGIVCCTNAETAHTLIHWKYALKEWVQERLQLDGWMSAGKLEKRERMKGGKRRKLANKIVDGWREQNIVASLYRDFKNTLEDARKKSTTGRHPFRDS